MVTCGLSLEPSVVEQAALQCSEGGFSNHGHMPRQICHGAVFAAGPAQFQQSSGKRCRFQLRYLEEARDARQGDCWRQRRWKREQAEKARHIVERLRINETVPMADHGDRTRAEALQVRERQWLLTNIHRLEGEPCAGEVFLHPLAAGATRLPEKAKLAQAFLIQDLHQPAASTFLPPKMLQGPCLSVALPWNSAQLPHTEPAL